jgi:hypothetical protein
MGDVPGLDFFQPRSSAAGAQEYPLNAVNSCMPLENIPMTW